MKQTSSLFSLVLGILLLAGGPASAKIYIDITQVSDRSFTMAIVPPYGEAPAKETNPGEKFAQVLEDDLTLMGFFRFVDRKAFLENAAKRAVTADKVDFASWAVLDALALVKGQFKMTGNKLSMEAHLFDVLLKQELMAKRYEGTLEQVPSMAHRFANEIIRILTGEPGVFDTRIAFVGKKSPSVKELYVMDFNGDNLQQLTSDRSIVLSPVWANDGGSIYYTSFKGGRVPQLYKYDLAQKSAIRITQFPAMVIGLELDPVSDLIATTLQKDGNSEIHLLTMSGAIHSRLTRNDDIDVSPSFSPDGKQMAFVSNRDGYAQIYKMDRNGDNPSRLTFKGKNNTSPAWSPKGNKILFAGMDNDGQFDIFSMNTDGSQITRLTYDSRQNEEPDWSSDGQLATFCSNRNGRYEIFIMRPDGTHQVALTRDPWDHLMPAWSPRSK